MNAPRALVLASTHYEQLRTHLFPGDGLEAAAIMICGRSSGPDMRLLVQDIILVPHSACRRRLPDELNWPGEYLELALDRAEDGELTIMLVHSHPGGLLAFSPADDKSDQLTMAALQQGHGDFHGSAIMTPDGTIRARVYDQCLASRPIQLVTVAGHDISFWWDSEMRLGAPYRRPMAFTGDMTQELGRLRAMVVGVSGTGSVVAEQLARLGFGHVDLVDHDKVEEKNLNRVLNSTLRDAAEGSAKVEMFAGAVERYRGGGVAEPIELSILSREAVLAASRCDVLFCCVDSLEARQVADLLSTAFLLPLFDVGVVIPTRRANGQPEVGDVCGRIDYIQPGRSTLGDRGVYSPKSLRAEYLRHNAPEAHNEEFRAGYIRGIIDEAPAVISLNMRAASACVNEFIARAYPFRHDENQLFARTSFSLAACEEDHFSESSFKRSAPAIVLGCGVKEPLLGLPILSVASGGGEMI